MTFPHSLKAGAILAILMVPVLTAQAFNLDFDQSSDLDQVTLTEFPETGSGWNATAGVDGGGGLAVLSGAYVGLFSSTIHPDDPSASFSVSAMFNAGPSGPVTTQEMGYPSFFALGFGDPSTNKQLGIVLNALEDNSIDASLWTLEAPIEISTSTGPFSLSEGNWYKLNSRFAWDASNSEWLVQLE